MLDDLFSHKIHATNLDEWERTLVKLAQVFEELNERPYDNTELEDRLAHLAPNAARSAFRDQFSIYMSVLGVGQIVWTQNVWRVHLSETAREFLLRVEPDVEAFCRLQLAMYQRPDGRGMYYEANGWHEHKSATEKLELIHDGYRVCPFRLILGMFKAKAVLDGVKENEVEITPEEIYALANSPRSRVVPNPGLDILCDDLERFRRGRIEIPEIKRKTFKFLESTGLVTTDTHANIRLRDCGSEEANAVRDSQVQAIRELGIFFDQFQRCTNRQNLVDELKTRRWAKYFDATRTLGSAAIEKIAGTDRITSIVGRDARTQIIIDGRVHAIPAAPAATLIPELSPRRSMARTPQVLTDPEETRIRRERRNAYHDLIIQRLANKIRSNELDPHSTPFIDLFTNVESIRRKLPGRFSTRGSYLENQDLPYFPAGSSDELSFLFEAKSSDDNIVVDQVRRAVGQLYEYRYRYGTSELKSHVILVLALQRHLMNFPWIEEYLLSDRRIGVCWLDENHERIICPRECMPVLGPFVDGAA